MQHAHRGPLDHSGYNCEREIVHTKNIELHLGLLGRGVQRRDRTERRCARVGAQDRDVSDGQFVAQLAAFGRVGEVDRTDLDVRVLAWPGLYRGPS